MIGNPPSHEQALGRLPLIDFCATIFSACYDLTTLHEWTFNLSALFVRDIVHRLLNSVPILLTLVSTLFGRI